MIYKENKIFRKMFIVTEYAALTVCTFTLFVHLSINGGIHLAEIFRTFNIRFRMKCTLDSDMPTALVISRMV